MDCPICGGKLVGDRPKLRCLGCSFQGSIFDFEVKALEIIDDRYGFYICREFNLALFYREKAPQNDPVHRAVVDIPDLDGKEVLVELVGLGQEGKNRLLRVIGETDVPIFPVDLWHDPGCICPRLSRTVDEKLMEEWWKFVSSAQT